MSIVIENLTHTYMPGSPFQATAIHGVSLTIRDGEFIGLIGHTGSGKSTLIQHLNGLLRPSSGRVLIDGKDLFAKDTDKREVRRKVGLVFQYPENQLFEETVAADIAFGPKNLGLSPEEVDARVRDACAQVHLDYETFKDRSVFELSGGQMRRAAIAGVLAMQPQTLILDEPCAGLDPRGRDEILGLVRELHQTRGTTVVMVSHSMDDVASLVSRVIVMNRGQIAMDGTPREVFRQGEALRAMGLDVPEAARLAARLREKGFDVPQDAYLHGELLEAIKRIVGGAHA